MVALAAAGLAALGLGVVGLFADSAATRPTRTLVWLAGGLVAHDALFAPAAAIAGLALSRLVRPPYRAVVQGAAIVSASVATTSFPLWRGYGGGDDPSSNPLPYGRNLLLVLGAIWCVAGVIMLARRRQARAGRSGGPAPAASPRPPVPPAPPPG